MLKLKNIFVLVDRSAQYPRFGPSSFPSQQFQGLLGGHFGLSRLCGVPSVEQVALILLFKPYFSMFFRM